MSWLLLHDPWPGSYADPDAGRQAGRLFDGVLVSLCSSSFVGACSSLGCQSIEDGADVTRACRGNPPSALTPARPMSVVVLERLDID